MVKTRNAHYTFTGGYDTMNEQQVTVQRQSSSNDQARGIRMFKDRVAAMRSGPWQLGGDKTGQAGKSVTEQGDA